MELKELKEKVEEAKAKKAKAEGIIEQIEKQIKEEYDLTIPEVKEEIIKLEIQLKEDQEKYDTLIKKANEIIEG